MVKKNHTLNGKVIGAWHELESGKTMYLAYRTRRDIYRKAYAWMFDSSLIQKAINDKVDAVGVVIRLGGKNRFYVTDTDDLVSSPFLITRWMDGRKVGLPLGRFKISPGGDREHISATFGIR